MFIGSFPFGGMLGSCRREGMCMLTLISEKDKLIMLITKAQKCNTQTLSKTSWFDLGGGGNISKEKQA